MLEGAALRPEYVAELEPVGIIPLFLHADENFLRRRMMEEARRDDADGTKGSIIDKFIERSIRENRDMLEAAGAADIRCINVAAPGALGALVKEFSAP